MGKSLKMKKELWNIKKTGIWTIWKEKEKERKKDIWREVVGQKSIRNVRKSIRNIRKSIIILRESRRNREEDGRCWKRIEKIKKMGNFD